jgi:antibiotic biosynthesis monooxygenase (ABM) superfamily enzyme
LAAQPSFKELNMEVCIARASAAIVQRVPAEAADRFREWQHNVTQAAEGFPGYEGTDVYPPSGRTDEWVTVIHFESEESLQHWIDSPERARWVEKLRATVGDFELRTLQGGFSAWFTGLKKDGADAMPPAWKMALTVLVGLFPTVLLLTVFVGPFTSPLGFSFSMLIGNALSVATLQWAVVPMLTRVLRPWLEANTPATRRLSYGGVGVLLLILVGIAIVFRPITG